LFVLAVGAAGAPAPQTQADILKRLGELSAQAEKAAGDPAKLLKISQEIRELSAQLSKLPGGQPGSAPPAAGGAPPAGAPAVPAGDAPLEPERIAARLHLDISGTAQDSSREKTSGGDADTSTQYRASGMTRIAVAFRESLAHPGMKQMPAEALADWPRVYVPEGSLEWDVSVTHTTEKKWRGGSYRPPLGPYVAPGTRTSPAGWSKGTTTEKSCASATWRGEKKTLRALYERPAITLALTPHYGEDGNPVPDTMRFSIVATVDGTFTRELQGSSSDGDPTHKRESSPTHVNVELEGTFKKGAESVAITAEHVRWSGLETMQPPKGAPKIRIKGSLTFEKPAEPGVLAVAPAAGMESAGPDKNGDFTPSSWRYVLTNTGKSPIRFTAGATAAWLSAAPAHGDLAPGASTEVAVALTEKVKSLPDGLHEDTFSFVNATNGRGSTTRPARVDVGEVQVWRVRLTGQETDDMGGSLLYLKLEKIWKQVTVDYGVRFDYDLTAEFRIKKKKGVWTYDRGTILKAWISPPSGNFDPTVFFIHKIVCKNCNAVPNLKGASIGGEVNGGTFRLFWPKVTTIATVYNSLKLQHDSKDESHKGTSANHFESAEFFDRANAHELPLKNGVASTTVPKKSANYRFRFDKRPPIHMTYRYHIQRVK
jgi:hypothetical protein